MMTIIERMNGWHPVLLSAIALGVTAADINEWLRTVIYVLTIIYMVWRFARKPKKPKEKKDGN